MIERPTRLDWMAVARPLRGRAVEFRTVADALKMEGLTL
jgi:hypothetical protein